MATVLIVLLDGFSGDDVYVTAGSGERRHLTDVTTRMLRGYAENLTLEIGDVEEVVRVEVVSRGLEHSQKVTPGHTLLVSVAADGLRVRDMDEAPGFM